MASRGVNKVILVGYLGQDPEVRYMPNGGAVANITLATSESWKDRQTGEDREKTEWHRVVLFGKLAEVAGEYLRKGAQVYVEGALQTRKWTDQAGIEKYTTEVIVNVGGTMQMLGGRRDGARSQQGDPEFSGQAQRTAEQAAGSGVTGTGKSRKKTKASTQREEAKTQMPQGEWPPANEMDDIPF